KGPGSRVWRNGGRPLGRRSIPGRRLFGRAVEHGADDPTLYSPTRLSSCSVYLDRRPAIFACRLRSAYPCAPSENWHPAAAQWLFDRGTVFPSLLLVERCRHLLHVARVAPVDSFVAPRDAPKRCAGTIVWDAVSIPRACPITRSDTLPPLSSKTSPLPRTSYT